MRAFRALLLLLALATAGALAWHSLAADPGYVLLVWRGWSLETTALVAIAALLVLLLLLRLLVWLVAAPLGAWRRRAEERARRRLAEGLVALREGRQVRGVKLLAQAAQRPELELAARIEAARAALAADDRAQARELLAPLDQAPLAVLELADDELARGEYGKACLRLDEAASRFELPPRGWWLRIRALIACDRAEEAIVLLPELRRLRALPPSRLQAEEAALAAAALLRLPDYGSLRRGRRLLARGLRRQPAVVDAFAARCAALGLHDVAARAIEGSLAKAWSDELAARYGQLPATQYAPRLRAAEGWLEAHPDSPALLLCLGRLCRADGLWGKAENYLERALRLAPLAEAWEVLGQCYAEQGEEKRARLALDNALRAGRGEATQPLPPRDRSPTPGAEAREERSSMGVPRLPAALEVRLTEGDSR